MSQIVTFFSPKTAGASAVSINAVLLQKTVKPNLKVAFLEIAGWGSVESILPTSQSDDWGKFEPFIKTPEWDDTLVSRLAFNFGVDVFRSPSPDNFPKFSQSFVGALSKLLVDQYDLIVVDISAATSSVWQDYWFQQSSKIIGVVSPDPVSLSAWEKWLQQYKEPYKVFWLLNQASPREQKRLKTKFGSIDDHFLGCLPTEPLKFWYQIYERVPVAMQGRSSFIKHLQPLLLKFF